MDNLQSLIESYLESADFNILVKHEGFLVADKRILADRDTRLIWVAPEPDNVRNYEILQKQFIQEFETKIREYPDGRYYLIADTLYGLSPEFRSEAHSKFRVRIRTKVQFFDTPYRHEESEFMQNISNGKSVASTLRGLHDKEILQHRIPQRYSELIDREPKQQKDDLLNDLVKDLKIYQKSPCIRIVVGPAGAGKTMFFKSLYTKLYDHFMTQKKRNILYPRPIPFIPEHLRGMSTMRVQELIDNLIRSDVATPVPPTTFNWMLINGFSSWYFDGLDELYLEDPDFFDMIADLLTSPDTRAQILVCARNSLLTSCEPFNQFIQDYTSTGENVDAVKIYQLDDWDYASKRNYAWLRLRKHIPEQEESDPPEIKKFLDIIQGSPSLNKLSTLPYYCKLLIDEYIDDRLEDYPDDFTLVEHSVNGIVKREMEKGLLRDEYFHKNGLMEWLDNVAVEFFEGNFQGLTRTELEEYAALVLREELNEMERQDIITSLVQFPLFTKGIKPGLISFKHELIAEYLAGRALLKQITDNPGGAAQTLSNRFEITHSFILNYIAHQLGKNSEKIDIIVNALKTEALPGLSFSILLQLFLITDPARNSIKKHNIELEGRNLTNVQFSSKDLNNLSLRNCDLSYTVFKDCDLRNVQFEGACLSGTKFDQISKGLLAKAHFGKLDRFEFVNVGKRRIEDYQEMIKWVEQETGVTKKITGPCPAAKKKKKLFLKFVYANGQPRRDELTERALLSGKRYAGAPEPNECLDYCKRFEYLQGPDFRGRFKRTPGDRYQHIINYVTNWSLSVELRQLLNSLCQTTGCEHIPKSN